VDVAIAAGANGVHVGQTDIPVTIARRMLGPDALVGLTVKTATHLEQAPLEDISYFGMGGVFATSTKNNPSAPIGLDGVSELVRVARGRGYAGPLAAIAGIDKGNAGDVIRAGADGICVVSAVSRAADPGQAVAGLAQVVARARPER
jgi:thiamine-phosphate pyrophosphorylase